MRVGLSAAAVVVACAVAPPSGAAGPDGWKTYRSDAVGYALSFPATIDMRASFGGRSGTLVDATTGERLVDVELSPAGLCPRQPPGTTPKQLGLERSSVITQADGPDGSSVCDRPETVRERVSDHGVPYWELHLRCSGGESKGPTFFADVSQPWRVRVLTVDPIGGDPRHAPPARTIDPATVRAILATLVTFPVARPPGTCIDDP